MTLSIAPKLEHWHRVVRRNRWLWYFAGFNRLTLAAGFIPSGLQKVLGIRFTDLSNNHPMGAYLEALFHTGFYYPFIGYIQLLAALLLLVPRMATIGAFIYFPIILNITILSISMRFDGSLLTSPLMSMACLYLICWDYHKWKHILPWQSSSNASQVPKFRETTKQFPWNFFTGSFLVVTLIFLFALFGFEVKPRNHLNDCLSQFGSAPHSNAECNFCNCIHKDGKPLQVCLDRYKKERAPKDSLPKSY